MLEVEALCDLAKFEVKAEGVAAVASLLAEAEDTAQKITGGSKRSSTIR